MALPNTRSRWVKPLNVEPGHWKKQLPGKTLKLAEKGKLEEVERVLAEQPELLNKQGNHGRTLLWSAVRHGREPLVRFLLDRGADLTLTGCVNSDSFVQLSPLAACTFYGRHEIAQILEANGAADDLFRLTYRGESDQVLITLESEPELLHAEDPHDEIYYSPLLSFAIVGLHFELAKTLIDRGFDVKKYSFQLVFIASHFEQQAMLELLFKNGANVEDADASLWVATNNMGVLQQLVNRGLSANQRRNGDLTPLLYVCRADKGTRTEKLELILELGGDVTATANDGRTALHYAVNAGNFEACKLLLEAGIDTTLTGPNVPPAAELASQRGHSEIVALIRRYQR